MQHKLIMSKIQRTNTDSSGESENRPPGAASPAAEVTLNTARRRLFTPDEDRELNEAEQQERARKRTHENMQFAQRELQRMTAESSREWDFDFVTGQPMANPNRYDWTAVSPVKSPKRSRSSTPVSADEGTSSPSKSTSIATTDAAIDSVAAEPSSSSSPTLTTEPSRPDSPTEAVAQSTESASEEAQS